jgi:integrase
LSAFLTETWLPAIERTIKPGTFESYRRNVRLHIAGRSVGSLTLQQVQPFHLNNLYATLLAGDDTHRPLSARSVGYIAAIVHRAFRDAVRWQAIVRNPADAADPPRPSARPEMQTWTASQLGRFLTGIAEDRLAGAWWLLATTGMRRGEALGLRWADVELAAGSLRIVRTLITTDARRKGEPGIAWGTPKTAKGRRSVALDPTTVAALRQHRSRQLEERIALGASYADQDLVVSGPDGSPVHPKALSYYFVRESKRIGLPAAGCTISGIPTRRWRCARASTRGSCRNDSATRTSASPWIRTVTSTSTCRPPRRRSFRLSLPARARGSGVVPTKIVPGL